MHQFHFYIRRIFFLFTCFVVPHPHHHQNKGKGNGSPQNQQSNEVVTSDRRRRSKLWIMIMAIWWPPRDPANGRRRQGNSVTCFLFISLLSLAAESAHRCFVINFVRPSCMHFLFGARVSLVAPFLTLVPGFTHVSSIRFRWYTADLQLIVGCGGWIINFIMSQYMTFFSSCTCLMYP